MARTHTRHEILLAGCVFVACLALYVATLAPTITWRFSGSDSGELATAAFTWGVAHPTGYPTWTLLGFLITRIPLGDPAGRTNLLSALCGAAAAALVALTTGRIAARLSPMPGRLIRLVSAATAGLALAVAPAFWSQSILTEVYTLNCLLLGALFWLIAAPSGRAGAALVVAGLALTNHSTALIAVLPALVVLGLRARNGRVSPRQYMIGPLLFLLPLCLYALIPWRASQHPAENWNDPQTLNRFLAHVTGDQYRYLLQWRDPAGAVVSLPAVVRLFVSQFAWWVLPLSLYGLLRLWEVDRPLAVALFATACGLATFTAFYRGEGAQYYLLPAYLIEAVLLGVGLASAATDAAGWPPVRQLAPATGFSLLILLAAFTVLPRVPLEYADINLRHDRSARDYARATLRAAPPGATIRTSTDEQTFALWYVQRVEGLRHDVHVVDARIGGQQSSKDY